MTTQQIKTLNSREAFYSAMKAATISFEDYTAIATAANTWASNSYGEGIDDAIQTLKPAQYSVTATATRQDNITLVEPITP